MSRRLSILLAIGFTVLMFVAFGLISITDHCGETYLDPVLPTARTTPSFSNHLVPGETEEERIERKSWEQHERDLERQNRLLNPHGELIKFE